MIEKVVGWSMLAGLLAACFGDRWHWLVIAGTPWLVGAVGLAKVRPTDFQKLQEAVRNSRGARLTLIILTGMVLATFWLFGVAAGVVAVTSLAAVVFLALASGGVERALELTAGLTTAGITLLVVGLAAEAILSLSTVGVAWGSPGELERWDERYDSLAREGNLFGFRTPYERVAKPRGTFRVVAVGDSYTWGDKIAATEDTWPARMEAILENDLAGPSIEVVNLAERGFTTANEVELMDRLGWQFEPDVVVIQFLANDAFPSWPEFGRAGSADVFGRFQLVPFRFRQGAIAGSATLAFLEKEVNAVLQDGNYEALYEEGSEGWTQMRAAIGQLGRDAASRDVPVAFVVIPRFVPGSWAGATDHPDRSIHTRVAEVAEAAGLQVLDLTQAFAEAGRPGEAWWATAYDAHPGEEAHALVAEEVARFVSDHGWAPVSAGPSPGSFRPQPPTPDTSRPPPRPGGPER